MTSTSKRDQHRRAALALASMGCLYVVVGIPLTFVNGRAFGAPLFWLAALSFAAGWLVERRTPGQ
ncbi:hypothetical protein J7E97_17685 [Streptomyces sp. ISL-66]|uniref:hypothetical protein n=1 Tax=Streptomyces sp. ISL-66 TaxID=2819186 RepID=UPI001BE70101|nr:hypothetical protein [Streptomyces sp. ISL-66]MBT2469655.1 hypothetical protein [Streptomyces sp. ISL-66]